MATLTRKAAASSPGSAPTTPPINPTVTPAVSLRDAETPAASITAFRPEHTALSSAELEASEKKLVEYLRSPASLAAVEAVNPKIAQAAINAAVSYVTNRREEDTWPSIVRSNPQSALDAVVKLAAAGLVVSHVKGEAFLVPRFNKAERGFVITAVTGVRGMVRKLFESGKIASIDGNIVRAQDQFFFEEGLNPVLKFQRNLRPDPTKPNPVVGAYVIISSLENRPAKIKTVAIEEKEIKEGGKSSLSWSVNGDVLNTTRMGIDAAGVYSVQRPAMREVVRTWLRDNSELNALVELEDASYRYGHAAGSATRVSTTNPRESKSRGAGAESKGANTAVRTMPANTVPLGQEVVFVGGEEWALRPAKDAPVHPAPAPAKSVGASIL
mgnify:CR=1 FL=1